MGIKHLTHIMLQSFMILYSYGTKVVFMQCRVFFHRRFMQCYYAQRTKFGYPRISSMLMKDLIAKENWEDAMSNVSSSNSLHV